MQPLCVVPACGCVGHMFTEGQGEKGCQEEVGSYFNEDTLEGEQQLIR